MDQLTLRMARTGGMLAAAAVQNVYFSSVRPMYLMD